MLHICKHVSQRQLLFTPINRDRKFLLLESNCKKVYPELFLSETQLCFECLAEISDCLQSESAFHTWPWFCWGKNERLVIFALLRIHFLDHSENSSLNLVPVCSAILWILVMNYTKEYSLSSTNTSVACSLSPLTDWCVPALHLAISLWIPQC